MDWEFAFLDMLQNLHSDTLDAFFTFVTHLGDKGYIWIALGVVFLLFKKTRKIGITMLIALLLGVIIGNVTLKPLIARTRPFDIKSGIKLLISAPKDYSFPSGHTLSSFAAATAVFDHNKKYGAICYILAFLIAFSRLYLYVHFPTDVIAGMILGIALGSLAFFITKKFVLPKFEFLGE